MRMSVIERESLTLHNNQIEAISLQDLIVQNLNIHISKKKKLRNDMSYKIIVHIQLNIRN